MYQAQKVVSMTAATALLANRLVTYDGNYAGTGTLRYLGVTLKDGASGDTVPVGLPGVGVWPISCSENITAGNVVAFSANGQINVRNSSEKAVGEALATVDSGGLVPVLLYGPQAPALTT